MGIRTIAILIVSLGNILIDIQPDTSFNFLVCDFGFADYAPEAGKQFVAGMKRPSVVGITPRYAAPEVKINTFILNLY